MMKIRTIPGEFSGVNVRPAYHSLSFSRYTPRSPFATLSHTRSAARFSESSEHDEHSPLLEMEQRSRLNRKRRTRCDGPKAKGAASHGSVKAIFHRFNEVEIFWPLSPHPRTPLLTSPFPPRYYIYVFSSELEIRTCLQTEFCQVYVTWKISTWIDDCPAIVTILIVNSTI